MHNHNDLRPAHPVSNPAPLEYTAQTNGPNVTETERETEGFSHRFHSYKPC